MAQTPRRSQVLCVTMAIVWQQTPTPWLTAHAGFTVLQQAP